MYLMYFDLYLQYLTPNDKQVNRNARLRFRGK